MGRGASTLCPICQAKALARKTNQITPLYRENTYACTNIECGCVFVVGMEPVRIISPSSIPIPEGMNLPSSVR